MTSPLSLQNLVRSIEEWKQNKTKGGYPYPFCSTSHNQTQARKKGPNKSKELCPCMSGIIDHSPSPWKKYKACSTKATRGHLQYFGVFTVAGIMFCSEEPHSTTSWPYFLYNHIFGFVLVSAPVIKRKSTGNLHTPKQHDRDFNCVHLAKIHL